MLWIATMMLLAADPSPANVAPGAERQARAVVRIVRAARVHVGEGIAETGTEPTGTRRESRIIDEDGHTRRAFLLEFS